MIDQSQDENNKISVLTIGRSSKRSAESWREWATLDKPHAKQKNKVLDTNLNVKKKKDKSRWQQRPVAFISIFQLVHSSDTTKGYALVQFVRVENIGERITCPTHFRE
jgi:hypothetical protein